MSTVCESSVIKPESRCLYVLAYHTYNGVLRLKDSKYDLKIKSSCVVEVFV